MALIECFECGNQVSDSATTCPRCGVAIAATIKKEVMRERQNEEKFLNKFFKGTLSYQITTTGLMWLAAVYVVIAVGTLSAGYDSLFGMALVLAGVIGIIKGITGYSKMQRLAEEAKTQTQIIESGVSRAKNPGASSMADLSMVIIFAAFWTVVYLLMIAMSVALAPLMTVYIIYKVMTNKRQPSAQS